MMSSNTRGSAALRELGAGAGRPMWQCTHSSAPVASKGSVPVASSKSVMPREYRSLR